ncbi:MAG: hypothetical protein Ct9H300mP7_4740 [Verrucomicrobiota bacterium]|nr:MAG: hypothetical protein Ct9H300mP7_4740 [Verrucomicrobiota bacterium]
MDPRPRDVEEYDGRKANRWTMATSQTSTLIMPPSGQAQPVDQFPRLGRKPLRASAGHPVTQFWYAKQGSSRQRWSTSPSAKTWV